MKNKNIFLSLLCGILLSTTACSDFLDLKPLDAENEAIYFKNPDEFHAAAMKLHEDIFGWKNSETNADWVYGILMDGGTDTGGGSTGLGTTPTSDESYKIVYKWIRRCNNVIEKGETYNNPDEIAGSIGQAYFFRAWHHYFLVQRYGGVSILTKSPDTNDDILYAPRNSRYEVIKQVLDDLDIAISKLKNTTVNSTGNDGQVTLEAAKAFKARVCLYAGTWDKYTGTKTDGDGIQYGAGSNLPASYPSVNEFLTMAKELSEEIMTNENFQLWMGVEQVTGTGNDDMYAHCSYYYLFNLEGSDSNPAGLDKSTNKESIFRSVYDVKFRESGMNFNHTWPAGMTRKLFDMYLCTDGLPVHLSDLYQGPLGFLSEMKNRDYRLKSVQSGGKDDWDGFTWSWDYGYYGRGADYSRDITSLDSAGYMNVPDFRTFGGGGMGSRKYRTELASVTSMTSISHDCMHIRLAEMYLIYAEAVCELNNGSISDTDLDKSINKLRARGGVAPLNAALLAQANNIASQKGYGALTMMGEIRRERACELFAEGHRFHDLCRWGIAEQVLAGIPDCGTYLTYKGENNYIMDLINPFDNEPVFNPSAFSDPSMIVQTRIEFPEYTGLTPIEPGCIIGTTVQNRQFNVKHYLQPIPTDEIKLNPQLTQNPGW
ncbi:MAG: RagB/SusD family nutrient uptake outer membrane protein [Tannerellaceae bacterium]|nr:RagB/SusD family nutrient uptake outer membrane protein [Tannerellaceae bacterium]